MIEPTSDSETPRTWTRAAARRSRLAGAMRALGVVAATLAFGLAWALVEHALLGPVAAPAPYPRPSVPEPTRTDVPPLSGLEEPEPSLWLVDGFNVLHAGVLKGRDRAGWWRAQVQLRLVERVARFDAGAGEVWVVFDAAHERSERCEVPPAAPQVNLVFAPSADDWLVRRVRTAEAPERVAVVTGDRQVQGRVRHAGGRIVSPRAFLARCPDDEPAPATSA